MFELGGRVMSAPKTERGGGRPVAPRTRPELDELEQRLLQRLPKYRVMLHNDDTNSMDHVVVSLVRIVRSLTPQEAVNVMLEAHTNGVAQVIVCPKELAEHYRDGLRSCGLMSTIEPV